MRTDVFMSRSGITLLCISNATVFCNLYRCVYKYLSRYSYSIALLPSISITGARPHSLLLVISAAHLRTAALIRVATPPVTVAQPCNVWRCRWYHKLVIETSGVVAYSTRLLARRGRPLVAALAAAGITALVSNGGKQAAVAAISCPLCTRN